MTNPRLWLSVAQFVLVGGAVYWLLTAAAEQDLIAFTAINWRYLAAGILISTLALGLMGLRLAWVARAGDLAASPRTFVALNFRSVFYLFVLPLGIGMETARYVAFRHIFADASRRAVVAVVLTDRGLGLLTSMAFAMVAWLVLTYDSVTLPSIAALGVIVAASIVAARFIALKTEPVAAASIMSVFIHALTCAAVWLLGNALGVDVPIWLVVLAISGGVFGAVIPLALAGVQAGDFVAAGILDYYGVDTVTALTVASLYYLTRLEGALIGAVLEVGRSSTDLRTAIGARK